MLGLLKKYFSPQTGLTGEQSQADLDKKLKIAACVLILEIAKSDYEFSDPEKEAVRDILRHNLAVAKEEIETVLRIAEKERSENVDLYEYTSLINRNYSFEDKKKLVEMLWKIIYADGILDRYEDHLVHKVADLLHLSHEDLIEAKLKQKPADSTGRSATAAADVNK